MLMTVPVRSTNVAATAMAYVIEASCMQCGGYALGIPRIVRLAALMLFANQVGHEQLRD